MATAVDKQKKLQSGWFGFSSHRCFALEIQRAARGIKARFAPLQGHKKTQASYQSWSETQYLFGEFLRGSLVGKILHITVPFCLAFCAPQAMAPMYDMNSCFQAFHETFLTWCDFVYNITLMIFILGFHRWWCTASTTLLSQRHYVGQSLARPHGWTPILFFFTLSTAFAGLSANTVVHLKTKPSRHHLKHRFQTIPWCHCKYGTDSRYIWLLENAASDRGRFMFDPSSLLILLGFLFGMEAQVSHVWGFECAGQVSMSTDQHMFDRRCNAQKMWVKSASL